LQENFKILKIFLSSYICKLIIKNKAWVVIDAGEKSFAVSSMKQQMIFLHQIYNDSINQLFLFHLAYFNLEKLSLKFFFRASLS